MDWRKEDRKVMFGAKMPVSEAGPASLTSCVGVSYQQHNAKDEDDFDDEDIVMGAGHQECVQEKKIQTQN